MPSHRAGPAAIASWNWRVPAAGLAAWYVGLVLIATRWLW